MRESLWLWILLAVLAALIIGASVANPSIASPFAAAILVVHLPVTVWASFQAISGRLQVAAPRTIGCLFWLWLAAETVALSIVFLNPTFG